MNNNNKQQKSKKKIQYNDKLIWELSKTKPEYHVSFDWNWNCSWHSLCRNVFSKCFEKNIEQNLSFECFFLVCAFCRVFAVGSLNSSSASTVRNVTRWRHRNFHLLASVIHFIISHTEHWATTSLLCFH